MAGSLTEPDPKYIVRYVCSCMFNEIVDTCALTLIAIIDQQL